MYDRMLALDDGEEEGEGEDEEDEDNDEGDGDLIAIDPRIEALFASYAPKDENKIDSATFTLIVRNMGLFRSWSLLSIDGVYRSNVKSAGEMTVEEFAGSLESLSEADGRPFEEFLDTALTNISKRSSEVAWICPTFERYVPHRYAAFN